MKKRILVVDDDEFVRELLQEILKNDYEVKTAESAKNGLEVLSKDKINMIITDIRMNDINGYDFAKDIKSNYGDKYPILFISAEPGNLNTSMGKIDYQGRWDYLAKPFQIKDLSCKVKRLCKDE